VTIKTAIKSDQKCVFYVFCTFQVIRSISDYAWVLISFSLPKSPE